MPVTQNWRGFHRDAGPTGPLSPGQRPLQFAPAMRLEASHVGGRLGRRGIRHRNIAALRTFESSN